jgi:hypothetical protein
MNLRTITLWVLYHPKRREIITARKFRYELEPIRIPAGCVVVKMKGHYVASPQRAKND